MITDTGLYSIPLSPCTPLRPAPAAPEMTGQRPTDHAAPLPAAVVARGADNSCHGRSAS